MIEALATLNAVARGANLAAKAYQAFVKVTPTGRANAAYAEILSEDMAIETNANTRELVERFAAVQEQLSELAEAIEEDYAWHDQPEHERPTGQDVAEGFLALARAGNRAGTNRKREILYRAFYRRFDPEYYLSGQSTLLWEIANALEYPDFVALEHVCRGHDDSRQKLAANGQPDKRSRAVVQLDEEHWPHLARLAEHGLVYAYEQSNAGVSAKITALGRALITFAWLPPDERPDTPATE